MAAITPASHAHDGIILCRSVLACPQVAGWKSRIDTRYQPLEEARQQGGPAAASRLVAAGQRFVPTASSLTIGATLCEEDIHCLIAGIGAAPAAGWIRNELGTRIACDLNQAWVRRQYAPAHYPPWHAPHGWHQDGALGFDYPSHREGNYPPDALLTMVTCWIPLTPCGLEAPGLELVTRRLEGLLAPEEFTDERVRVRFTFEDFWQPVMQAGDALLFRGDILHRTHVTQAMTKGRTSIELRFFPTDAVPARLKGDRFVSLD
jgi:Phytanoyl-CoA dioxygenase (PhyH)